MKKKFLLYRDGALYYDKDCTIKVPKTNATYVVLQNIKIPQYLTDVRVVEQTWDQAQKGLIFIGIDSKGRKQYFYGKLHVRSRNERRDLVFVRVFNIMHKLRSFIEKYINDPDNCTVEMQLAVFMLMETNFYIRMGKVRYLKQNDTVGLLTLKIKHLYINDDIITIKFMGKDKIEHVFCVKKTDKLYYPLLKLYSLGAHKDDFLFNKLNERTVYRFMSRFGVRVKDLRTYGVNITFLKNLWDSAKGLTDPLPVKKLVAAAIKKTASIIGHSPGIAKHAYMALTVLELARDGKLITRLHTTSFLKFVKSIVEYIKKQSYDKWTKT